MKHNYGHDAMPANAKTVTPVTWLVTEILSRLMQCGM